MARRIYDIAKEVCDRTTVNVPVSLYNEGQDNDTIARRLRTSAQDTVRDMMRSAMQSGLSGFQSQWVFSTKPAVYSYQLPPDYYKMLPGTENRQRWPLGLLGPVDPKTWSQWISGIETIATPMGWRIQNNLIRIEPPPTSEEVVIIEYLSRYMVIRDAVSEDIETVDGYVRAVSPFVPREGYIAPGAEGVIDAAGATWGSSFWGQSIWGWSPDAELRRIPGSDNTMASEFPPYQVRQEFPTSDNDILAVDDDHIISLGMTWRFLKAMRRPYAEEKAEYELEKEVFLAQDASKDRLIALGPNGPQNEIVPLGGGVWLTG